jgi:hypothetical protein
MEAIFRSGTILKQSTETQRQVKKKVKRRLDIETEETLFRGHKEAKTTSWQIRENRILRSRLQRL